MQRPLSIALVALALLARGGLARAQTPPDLEGARSSFTRGVMLAQQERWSQALEEFRRSRRLADRPRTAFNEGLALQHLERYREARAALRECIAMPGVVAEADLVADAHALDEQVTRALVRLRLVVAPADAEVRVNGQVIDDDRGQPMRELDIDPGRQVVEVSAPGLAAQRFEVNLHEHESLQRRVDLAVIPGRVAVRVEPRDATVSVDDEVVGHGDTAWQGSPGVHRVRVEAPGFAAYRRPVTVTAGADLRVEVSLTSSEVPWHRRWWVWTAAGAVAVAGAVVAAAFIEREGPADGGSTQQVLQGVTLRW